MDGNEPPSWVELTAVVYGNEPPSWVELTAVLYGNEPPASTELRSELLRGEQRPERAADVFSYGIVVWELLTWHKVGHVMRWRARPRDIEP